MTSNERGRPSTDLDAETADLVTRLVDINATVTELNTVASSIKAELRHRLPVGVHTIDGQKAVTITVNRRFDPVVATANLRPELLALCTVAKVDGATAKRNLPPSVYAACMAEGEPVIRLA